MLVDHNPAIIRSTDYIVEIGPQERKAGGHVTFAEIYPELLNSDTITGKMLRQLVSFRKVRQPQHRIEVGHVTANNLNDVSLQISMGVMTIVSEPA